MYLFIQEVKSRHNTSFVKGMKVKCCGGRSLIQTDYNILNSFLHMNMFKPFLNTFHMYIIWTWKYVSRVQYLIHVFLFFLLLSRFSSLLLSVFFKFKRFKLIHLRWPPAVRIKSCLLSSIFHTSSYQQRTLMAHIHKIEALVIKLVRTRTKFVPKLPTKKL